MLYQLSAIFVVFYICYNTISNKRKLGDQMQLKDVGEFNFIRQIQDNTIYNPNTVVYGIGVIVLFIKQNKIQSN